MRLELLVRAVEFNGSVARAARQGELHRFAKNVEAISSFYRLVSVMRVVENYKSLTFGLEIRFGYDINHIAELREDNSQGIK